MRRIETWEELQIKNDFLFAKVMSDKKICIKLLEMLLHIKIKDIKYLEKQKALDFQKDAKSVRLDMYVEGDERVFDIEIQATEKRNLPKRSRYYQGMIDLNTIKKGEDYEELKESYVIFICTFDPFKKGRAQYTFENVCLEDKEIRLNDASRRVFFNARDYMTAENEDIREFLKYVNGGKSNHPFVKELETRVEQVKENKEWGLEYMTLRMREKEIWKEATEEATEKVTEEGIKKMVLVLKELNVPQQTILLKIQNQYDLSSEVAKQYL